MQCISARVYFDAQGGETQGPREKRVSHDELETQPTVNHRGRRWNATLIFHKVHRRAIPDVPDLPSDIWPQNKHRQSSALLLVNAWVKWTELLRRQSSILVFKQKKLIFLSPHFQGICLDGTPVKWCWEKNGHQEHSGRKKCIFESW